MGMEKLEAIEQFDRVMQEMDRFLFVKHSLTCPISQAAFRECEKFAADHPELAVYCLYVQEARPLSNYIAERTGVKHESPQVLLFENGQVVWHTSHWKITYDALKAHTVTA
ncbi:MULTISPECIES: bacillithiol system redox-active protein YtxJ [Geobacillus]|uniref:Bacillithiol system redox-active protein YtxJ n=1 Tax=Geobacillus thermodenitrificans TaxID=33940 RepID=A0ABY9QIS7_GEOTD|nr:MULTISPECIES: bacillithiol system redox-active protein YtxJ [Geobacillus]NNU86527.1 bacillithiol system redox-active protein YtxJ [Geobacillus sp. MR]ARA99787.1 thioredoxin family protein [Geobacillus thermodenitrificans]ATO39068.1 thioredoxin family protein [Geobacillus thermodenitrificans]MEC5187052.1 bacillithiol system protein YtxJ [Geobacillus thermodenitrificans]MED0662861.1 bacillithiol system redox-active protein YtxJ [Geobacillus thermodenitrificans]